MFADIVDSAQLYERLGDRLAHRCVTKALARIARCAQHNDGRLVENIGDQAMLVFSAIEDAVQAAIEIQQTLSSAPTYRSHFVKARIGFHAGPVEYAGTHPFGDTVNVAARVVSLCDAGRIITTLSSLPDNDRALPLTVRPYQLARAKGKSFPLQLRELLWDLTNATTTCESTEGSPAQSPPVQLELLYDDACILFNQESGPVTIGRGEECGLVINSGLASRAHARIEMRYGEVYLRDHSTNGTYVDGLHSALHLNRSVHVHRREIILNGEGLIGIGEPVESARQAWLLRYTVR